MSNWNLSFAMSANIHISFCNAQKNIGENVSQRRVACQKILLPPQKKVLRHQLSFLVFLYEFSFHIKKESTFFLVPWSPAVICQYHLLCWVVASYDGGRLIHKNANTRICKYTNMQIHKNANTQICKYTKMQIHKMLMHKTKDIHFYTQNHTFLKN